MLYLMLYSHNDKKVDLFKCSREEIVRKLLKGLHEKQYVPISSALAWEITIETLRSAWRKIYSWDNFCMFLYHIVIEWTGADKKGVKRWLENDKSLPESVIKKYF